MNLTAIFVQTLDVTLPVFTLVFIGIAMRHANWIDDRFVSAASTIVFKGSMPALIFVSIVGADLGDALRPGMLAYFGGATLVSFLAIWAWALWRVPIAQRGVYTQGAFRGNCGIMGLALAQNMYGNFGLSAGSVLVGEVILIYNVLSVIVLTWYQPDQSADWRSIGRGVATNPLILATVASIAVAASGLPMPQWIMTSGQYFAQLTLPLALICIGGALSVRALYDARGIAVSASVVKMLVLPTLAVAGGWWLGFAPRELGLMFLYFACPTAASSFIMVEAMGGDARLAANIVALTTLAASLTMTLGVFALRMAGLI
ncbi:AEC family transporter [Salinisphaera sp. Q1T1-3]|uniref:AEC family transporter n=1 Tax=Salinisphaera sp. Q1T1-3 TaxID=2321229 RepID=UPI000E75C9D6|nr:AEC family transporter [Salinisphaera sp. Q1T1-3]RJS91933.1 AEC family transporter [Salinisphaera sp. Q1T1-3]